MNNQQTLSAAAAGTFTIGGDLTVNRMGYGAMRITGPGVWGPPADKKAALTTLWQAIELGVNLIDTADSYGPHISEELIAEALYPYPDGLVIATKGGWERPGPGQWTHNASPKHLTQALEGSLKRLQLDRIDIYQLHAPDNAVSFEASVEALATSIKEGGFYGWPWYYMGDHQDPRLPEPCANGTGPNPQAAALTADEAKTCNRVDLASKVITPDVLVQPHMASLEMVFYPDQKEQFPEQYDGDAFAAEHGSWNRANRAGYEVIRIPMHNGRSDGSYEDFLTGYVTKDGQVWGRPVGVAIANDGSLFVTDDGSRSVWHVTYTGKQNLSASNRK